MALANMRASCAHSSPDLICLSHKRGSQTCTKGHSGLPTFSLAAVHKSQSTMGGFKKKTSWFLNQRERICVYVYMYTFMKLYTNMIAFDNCDILL